MMFAATPFVDPVTVAAAGFQSRADASEALLARCKVRLARAAQHDVKTVDADAHSRHSTLCAARMTPTIPHKLLLC